MFALLRVVWHCEYVPGLYPVTTLARSASVTEAATLHWKQYVMESMEPNALMLCTCIWGTLTYSDESPLRSLGPSAVSNSTLMGKAVAVTTFIIIRSPFGRRSGAHMNPSVTLTFLWFGTDTPLGCCVVCHGSIHRRNGRSACSA
jgi:aquaporin Z